MNKLFTPLLLAFLFTVTLSAQVVTDKQVTLITKITADWCPKCGTWGWQFTDQLKTAIQGKDAILWNVHHSGGLETPTSNEIANNLGGFSQPLIFLNTDQDDIGLSPSNIPEKIAYTLEAIDLNSLFGALVALGSEAKLEGSKLNVNTKIKFLTDASSGEYYIGMYLVEKNKVAYQQSVGNNAVHPSVLTKSILSTTFGNKIATAPIQDEEEFSISGSVDNLVLHNGKLEDTKVVTILWVKDGDNYIFNNAREVNIVLDNTSSTVDSKNSKLDFTTLSASGEVEIKFNKTVSDKIDIQLYNVAGQKVEAQIQKINGETYKVNTGDVSGNHFVTIRENNELISKQILIIR